MRGKEISRLSEGAVADVHHKVDDRPATHSACCFARETVKGIRLGEQREGGNLPSLTPVIGIATCPCQLHAKGMSYIQDGDLPQSGEVVFHSCGLSKKTLFSGSRIKVAPHAVANRVSACSIAGRFAE